MTKRTRYFLIGSATVLVLGLCTGLVGYYGGGLPSLSAGRTGPAELSYVPADAAVVAYADVRQVMASEFRQRVREIVPEQDRGQEEFRRETGIDIERDIDHVVACVIPGDGRKGSGFVVARGRFNTTQLERLARQHGAQVEEYRGKRLLTASQVQASEKSQPVELRRSATLAFLEPGLVAIGEEAAIKRAIDAEAGQLSITDNEEMMRLVADIESAASAWAVGHFDALAEHARLPDEVSRQIPALKWFAATGRVDGGIAATFRAEARDEQAAENLRDVIRGFLALVRMQAGNNPKVQAFVQTLQLSGSGTTVALSFSVPVEIIDEFGRREKAEDAR